MSVIIAKLLQFENMDTANEGVDQTEGMHRMIFAFCYFDRFQKVACMYNVCIDVGRCMT